MVPLIAIDELPPTINIRGVPRSLEAKDLTGMTCAGAADSRHRTYIVDMPNDPPASRTPPTPTGHSLNDSLFATSAYTMRPTTNPNIFPQPPKAYGISEQMPSHIKSPVTGNQVPISSFTNPNPSSAFTAPLRVDRNPGPNPLPPWQDATSVPMKAAPGIKEYCSYWLRYGECDYAQQGCLYKHEMPLDRDLLEVLGHRDIPKWYREKHGLGSFLAGGNGISGEKGECMERSWRIAKEAEDRERDSAGGERSSDARVSKRKVTKVVDTGFRGGKNVDKKAMLWRDEWEKKGDGRFAPKSSGKVVASPVISPTPMKTSPVKTSPKVKVEKISPVQGRGPASRSVSSTATASGPASRSAAGTPPTNGHHQSLLAKKTDEACLAALEADIYAKDREKEELKRLRNHEVLQPKRRSAPAKVVTPETSSSDESADFEYGGGRDEDSEWVEGDAESQATAISNDAGLRGMRLERDGK
jgi:hypothetical protein